MSKRFALALVIALSLGLGALPIGAASQDARDRPASAGAERATLYARLHELVTQANLGDRVGVCVLDAQTGREIFSHRRDMPLNPASNVKLVTAAAALLELGAEHRMLTGLYGRISGDSIDGGLFVRGYGDPTLRMADLVELAADLADRGVRRVDRVVVDGRYFDDRALPPAFDQQPHEASPFRAAVGAVSVDANAYALRIAPAAAVGAIATVRLDAPGYFEIDNGIVTSEGGAPAIVADQRSAGDRLALRLRGTIPSGIPGVAYRRRVESPLPYAGHALVAALRRVGIRSRGEVVLGATPADAPLLASHTSPPLSTIITAMGKDSDNFTAEMVLKVLGAERAGRPGRSAGGVRVALDVLERAGVPRGRARLVNGSGLFQGNALAPSHLARLLVHVYQSPAVRAEYVAHLSIAGVDGTLANRLRDLPRPRIVRAKTGTLADAIALSGYVLGPRAGQAVAFSFLANGVEGKQGAARELADSIVRAIAADLWPAQAAASASRT